MNRDIINRVFDDILNDDYEKIEDEYCAYWSGKGWNLVKEDNGQYVVSVLNRNGSDDYSIGKKEDINWLDGHL
jgi:hypothetical protein